jgi:hypothetical protein
MPRLAVPLEDEFGRTPDLVSHDSRGYHPILAPSNPSREFFHRLRVVGRSRTINGDEDPFQPKSPVYAQSTGGGLQGVGGRLRVRPGVSSSGAQLS